MPNIKQNLKNSRLDKVNLLKFGTNRDRAVLKDIETLGALNTEQIVTLHFPNKSGERSAQVCLARLVKNKQLRFCRFFPDTPNVYFIGRRNGRIEHLVDLNWVYAWFHGRLMSGQSIYYWKREINYKKVLQVDALVGIQVPGEIKWYFIELDRANSSHNEFDKIEIYNDFYSIHDTMNLWWVDKAKMFPKILVVTENERRKRFIEEQFSDPGVNIHGLRFEVRLLADIIREAKA